MTQYELLKELSNFPVVRKATQGKDLAREEAREYASYINDAVDNGYAHIAKVLWAKAGMAHKTNIYSIHFFVKDKELDELLKNGSSVL